MMCTVSPAEDIQRGVEYPRYASWLPAPPHDSPPPEEPHIIFAQNIESQMYFIKNPKEPSWSWVNSPLSPSYTMVKKYIVLPSRLQRNLFNQDRQAGPEGGGMHYYKAAHFQLTIHLKIWKLLLYIRTHFSNNSLLAGTNFISLFLGTFCGGWGYVNPSNVNWIMINYMNGMTHMKTWLT